MNYQADRLIWRSIAQLQSYGIAVPDAIKARDPREPHLEEKMIFETRIIRAISKHFRQQRKEVISYLETAYPGRKVDIALPYDLLLYDGSEDALAELIRIFTAAANDGVLMFSELVRPAIDLTGVNAEAARIAATEAGRLVEQLDETTTKALRKTLTQFVENPGMTVGDVIGSLKYTLGPDRALTVAVTEITNVYAKATQIAGEELAHLHPGVPVVKIWYTNRDDRVCPVCGPLEGKEVGINEYFDGNIYNPPAHTRCRCWTQTTTRIGDE